MEVLAKLLQELCFDAQVICRCWPGMKKPKSVRKRAYYARKEGKSRPVVSTQFAYCGDDMFGLFCLIFTDVVVIGQLLVSVSQFTIFKRAFIKCTVGSSEIAGRAREIFLKLDFEKQQ